MCSWAVVILSGSALQPLCRPLRCPFLGGGCNPKTWPQLNGLRRRLTRSIPVLVQRHHRQDHSPPAVCDRLRTVRSYQGAQGLAAEVAGESEHAPHGLNLKLASNPALPILISVRAGSRRAHDAAWRQGGEPAGGREKPLK